MIAYKRAASNKELKQILALQQANLPTAISSEEKRSEGFVTVEHKFDLLKQMNDVCPHIIATEGDKVVGYSLCMHPDFRNHIEVLKPLFSQIDKLPGISEAFIVMGQICIAKSHRNRGIFRGLYGSMTSELASHFNHIITEVDTRNTRSLQAHYAVGFKSLMRYQAQDKEWELIGLPIA